MGVYSESPRVARGPSGERIRKALAEAGYAPGNRALSSVSRSRGRRPLAPSCGLPALLRRPWSYNVMGGRRAHAG
jgi:hypothetical protein